MPSPLAQSLKDLFTDLKPDATYASVEANLLRHNSQSTESRSWKLIDDAHLGDKTPEFLRRLRDLFDSPLLGKLFFSRQPSNMLSLLAPTMDACSLDQLAAMADQILEFSAQSTHSMVTSTTKPVSRSSQNILEPLEALRHRMNALWAICSSPRCQRIRGSSHLRPRSPGRAKSNLCLYHARFSSKAYRYIPPYSFDQSRSKSREKWERHDLPAWFRLIVQFL